MENGKRLWIAMVILCAAARLLPHPWNFTPLMAIGLFSGYQASKASTGILVTLSALALSDAVLGFHSGFWFVYAAALVAVLFGRITRNRGGVSAIAAAALASSLSFFLITNFMVWATSGMYPISRPDWPRASRPRFPSTRINSRATQFTLLRSSAATRC